jgi:hypothetical protein
MLFGGSSFIHLLASHPRVVALFGMGALVSSLLVSPLGTPNLPGTAGHLGQMNQFSRAQEIETVETVARAERAARHVAEQASPARLAEIVDTTVARCGKACVGIDRTEVLANSALLRDVLLLHSLEEARQERIAGRITRVGDTAERQ